MPTRRTVLAGLALATGASFTRTLSGLALSDAEILRDPMRPAYHLLPVRGWMNDPCGPIY
jgi:beta-fructofuranosidase